MTSRFERKLMALSEVGLKPAFAAEGSAMSTGQPGNEVQFEVKEFMIWTQKLTEDEHKMISRVDKIV